MGKVLIIDDERQLRGLLARIIGLEGYEVIQAENCAAGLRQLERTRPEVVLCDVKLPDGNGVDLVGRIKAIAPDAEVILLTAYGNIPDGVQAIKNGAFDYITKGDDNPKIIPLLSRAMEKAKAQRKSAAGRQPETAPSFEAVIGSSKAMRDAVELARKVAATDTSVLLTGETGTGKEVFAQAIHREGGRSGKAFVAVNCSAFAKDLLESELFGHRAGAFTGAAKDKKGLFEEADGGTIFLDEIGEMPIDLQAKLLRVLESGEFLKIGETKPRKVDMRVIAATNRDLPEEIRGISWFGYGASDPTYITPLWPIMRKLPDFYNTGDRFHPYDSKSGWWVNTRVQEIAGLHYQDARKDIHAARDEKLQPLYVLTPMVQDKAAELIKAGKRDEAISLITDFAYANAVDFNQRWQTLGDVLLGKYALGYGNFKTTPYPQEWNDFIGYGPITRPAKYRIVCRTQRIARPNPLAGQSFFALLGGSRVYRGAFDRPRMYCGCPAGPGAARRRRRRRGQGTCTFSRPDV